MTTIHTFEDILAVLERDPELRDAMHRHILGEEIPELPAAVRQVQDVAINLMQNQAELSATARAAIEATANTLAQFMEQTTLLMANASERQTAIENDTAELREGQVGLTAGVAELRERTTRLESITARILEDLTEVKGGMAQANERLDSLETGQAELTSGQAELKGGMAQANERLNSLETGQAELKGGMAQANERLDSLETGQAELKGGMAQANERLDSLETGQAELKAGQAELTSGQAELKAGQVSMRGQLNRLTGSDYERRVVRRLRRSAERRFGLYNAMVLHGITMPDNSSIPDLLDAALQSGDITENEANDAELADIIIGGNSNAATMAYAVIEASVTVDRHDVDRAVARAAIISKAANAPATAAVAGTSISEADRQHADNNSVTVIILPD